MKVGSIITLLPIVANTYTLCNGLSTPFGATTRNVATQVLQGTGNPLVDMNQYNLESLELIENEWTANVVSKRGESDVGIFLRPKSDKEIFADLVTVNFPRRKEGGLGIQLVELAGGREDGVGITLVSGLVEGGCAFGADILPGDSITQVSVIRKKKKQGELRVDETQEETTVQTECLDYDSTVDAILSLPAPMSDTSYEDFFEIKLKRLRRKPKVKVNLQYPPSQGEEDVTLELYAGENLRQGMLVRGVKLNDPFAKRFDTKNGGNCGAGGLCRTCVVSMNKGQDMLNPQRAAEKQMLEDTPRWRLACKAIVGYGMKEGEMSLKVNPRQW